MIEQQVDVKTPDGVSDAVVHRPTESDAWPAVTYLTDIGGIRDSHRHMAQLVSSLGYAVLMPNVFYRTGRPPLFPKPFKAGDEESMKRFKELSEPLTPEAMQRDVASYVDFLAAQDFVQPKNVGVVGYCFTGKMAVYAAALRPEVVKAVATFHGSGLYSDAPSSPHRMLPNIKARLYFGHATNDRSMNAEAIERFNEALAAWGGDYKSEVYSAAHSWTVPDSPVYNQQEAEKAFAKLTELLAAM